MEKTESLEAMTEKNEGVIQTVHAADLSTIKDNHAIGIDLYAEAMEMSPEELEAENARVRRKIDLYLMPILCITYTLQFLDKLSLNYAAAYSLIADVGLTGQRYSWVAAIFNFGYLFWAYPANIILQRVPVAKYTSAMLFCWAILLIGHIGAKNYGGMLVLRFLLGMFEASISPSVMMLISMFYTREEQPLRLCLTLSFNGMATMVGALLAYGLGHATAIKPWKLIFMVIGLMNFVWSIIFFILTPDTPGNARFLTHKERIIAVNRVAKNMMGIKDTKFKLFQAKEAFFDFKIWLLALIGLACGVINGGVSNFSSALIKGYGFTGIMTTLLQLPTGAIEFVLVIICGVIAVTKKNTRCCLLMLIVLPPLGGLIGIKLTPLDKRWSLVGCTWLQYLVGAPVVLAWTLLTANVAGHSKRTTATAMWFTLYAAGNIVGANIFLAKEAPRYVGALTGLIVCYVGMFVCTAIYMIASIMQNRSRDKTNPINHALEQDGILEGFNDLTDKENKLFRYQL